MSRDSDTGRQTPRRLGTTVFVCGVVLAGLALAATHFEPSHGVAPVPSDARIVVLGSSIAMADVDGVRLADRAGEVVAHLGERASQPAHWLAWLRHRVPREAPVHAVVVVSPLEVLGRERLRSEVDVERLLVLLSRPDPMLWDAAVGQDGVRSFWNRQAAGLRRVARGALGLWLPQLLGLGPTLLAARSDAAAVPRSPADQPRWVNDPSAPRPGRARDQTADREPKAVAPASWTLLPALVREAAERDAAVWVVAPPVRPSERGPRCARSRVFTEAQAALEQLGATVLDASELPLAEGVFRTRYHLEGEGTERFTDALAAALGGEALPGPVCGGPTPLRAGGLPGR